MRDSDYLKLLRQMDGFILTLDGEKELLPLTEEGQMLNDNSDEDSDEGTVKLEKLLTQFSSIPHFPRKPAALVVTKCDRLFRANQPVSGQDSREPASEYWLDDEKFEKLFGGMTKVEQALWQQPDSNDALRDAPYRDGWHEAVQRSWKPLLWDKFPLLSQIVRGVFSRVDVFPESSIGRTHLTPDQLNQYSLAQLNLKPFHSSDPFFWLMDMVEQRNDITEGSSHE